MLLVFMPTMIMKKPHLVLLALLFLLSAACNNGADYSGHKYVKLEVWLHSGQESERRVLQEQVARFNSSQYEIRVNAVILPAGTYNARIRAADRQGKFPDILEFNGPQVYPYIERKKLIPLDKLLTDNTRNDLLPSVLRQSMFQGRIYLLATHDSTLVLYGRRSKLLRAGIRIPASPSDAWTSEEFTRLLGLLATQNKNNKVLDLKLNRHGEWLTYAFAPILWSAGGALIHPQDHHYAAGVLNSVASITAMKTLQSWITQGYVDPNNDDRAFVNDRVALSWADQREYPRYHRAAGDDLVILPLPDFGRGSRSGQGGWGWGVSTNCQHTRAAMRFLEFLFRPDEILAMADASGTIPATRSAIAQSQHYRAGGVLNLFVRQLESTAVSRPQSAAYTVITTAFQQAFITIRHGGNVKTALDKAAARIDQSIKKDQAHLSLKKRNGAMVYLQHHQAPNTHS